MGKSKNASFSCADKSNFQLLKDKLKEKKRVNQKLKSDIKGRNCESEKKTKKSLWSKWLTSVRESWSSGGGRSPPEGSQRSLDGSVNLFQMPIDLDKKPFKMKVEASETELKTVVTEYCGFSGSEETFPKKKPVFRNDSQPIGGVKKDKTILNRDSQHRLVKDTKEANGGKEQSQKIEPLLTSALFIHKNLDKMVESAVLMEPTLPRDYAESKQSDEIIQKPLRINNTRVSFKNQEKDRIIETLKTASEPSWEEKKKIIHRQQLDENLNYLVKEFVFLGTEDIMDFPRLTNGTSPRKKNHSLNHSSGFTSRDLSREVSPEILVNIKPFKEYLSDSSGSCQKSLKRSRFADRQFRLPKNKPARVLRKVDTQKVSETCTHPVLKSSVTLLKKNDTVQDEENFFEDELIKHDQGILTLSPVQNKRKATRSENGPEGLTHSFSFWDMRKTCPKSKNFVQVEVELGSASFQFTQKKREERMRTDLEGEEEILRNSRSLDEVLDDLEDVDHDLIFQKNLSHFKKKISVMPRFDFGKSKFCAHKRVSQKVENKVWQKLIRVENPVETENHSARKFAKIADFSLGDSMEKKIEICRSKCLDLQKSEKVLENIYLMFYEISVINQIFATRIEAKMFSLCQTLREVHDMQENNVVVVIKVENPTNFDETSPKILLLPKVTPVLLQKSYLEKPKESKTITMFFSTDLDLRKIMKMGLFSENDEKFAQLPRASRYCQSVLIKFNVEEGLIKKFIEFSKELKTNEEDWNKPKPVEYSPEEKKFLTQTEVEICYEISRRVAFILNDPFYDYTALIYEQKIGFLKHCRKFYSESNIFKKLVYEKRHRSDSALIYKATKMASSEAQKSTSSRSRNFTSCGKQATLLSAGNVEAKEMEKKINECGMHMLKQMCDYKPRETKSLKKCIVKKTHGERETHISNFVQYSKIRACADQVEETFVRIKPDVGKSPVIPIQLMLKQEGEVDKRITFQLRKSGANLKKELVAAMKLMKDLNSSKGEAKESSKQKSLIILFSKN